jgi:hypothetical protein
VERQERGKWEGDEGEGKSRKGMEGKGKVGRGRREGECGKGKECSMPEQNPLYATSRVETEWEQGVRQVAAL